MILDIEIWETEKFEINHGAKIAVAIVDYVYKIFDNLENPWNRWNIYTIYAGI